MKKKILVYVSLLVVWGVIVTLTADQGIVVSKDVSMTITVTDTIVDTLNATVTTGLVTSRGLRANGVNFNGYVTDYITVAEDDDSVWFDTAVTMIRSHPAGFVVATKTRTATVFRLTCTGAHFDSLYGTIHAATDSMTIDFDSTGKTTRHRVGTCDSAISATVVALRLTQATADADSFYIGWTATPKAYHATIRDDVDSVATHVELDTTWGARSFDSIWCNASRSGPVTGWTIHGLKRGGKITKVVDTTEWFTVPPGYDFSVHLRNIYFDQKDSTIAWTKLQTKMINDARDNQAVDVCSSAFATDTTLAPANWFIYNRMAAADSAIATGGHLGQAFRFISTVVDSESRPASYGRASHVRFLNFIRVKY
jgi:hypothetical protein